MAKFVEHKQESVAAVRCVKINESEFLLALRKDAKRIFIEFKSAV